MLDCHAKAMPLGLRPYPKDLAVRAYLLGLSLERAKFLIACPHSNNLLFRKSHHVVVVPFDEQVQIDEAKRIGLGARDAAKMFNKTVDELMAQGFKRTTAYPKPPGNGEYSLFQYEDHQDLTRYLKSRNKYKAAKPRHK